MIIERQEGSILFPSNLTASLNKPQQYLQKHKNILHPRE